MPSSILVGTDTYSFKQWEDGSTNPIRTINLVSDMSLSATYELVSQNYVTPWSGSLLAGPYEIDMPSNLLVGADTYNFKEWEDGSTNPTRAINLVSDMIISAAYEIYTPPPTKGVIQVHAFLDSNEVVTDGLIVELNQTFQTPATDIEVEPGTYTIKVNLAGYPQYSTSITIVAGQTIRVDAPFTTTPITPTDNTKILIGGAALLFLVVLRRG